MAMLNSQMVYPRSMQPCVRAKDISTFPQPQQEY